MATNFDNIFVPLAADLIGNVFGEVKASFTLKGVYDETTMITPAGATISDVLISPLLKFSSNLVDGDTIRESDFKVMVAPALITFAPELAQKVTLADGRVFTVIKASPTWSGQQIAAWTLQLRGVQ